MKKLLATVPALTLALTLTACGNDDEPAPTPPAASSDAPSTSNDAPTDAPSSPAPSDEPEDVAAGNFVTPDYTTVVPDGWEDQSAAAAESSGPGGTVQAAWAAPKTAANPFSTNANGVAVEGAPQLEGQELIDAFKKEIESVVDSSEVLGEKDIDGETGVAFKSKYSTNGVDLTLYQMQVYRDDTSYVFTVTTADAAEGQAVFDEALANWSWTS